MQRVLIGSVVMAASLQGRARADGGEPAPEALLTVAERSGFRATACYDEVVSLLDRIAEASPHARRTSMGATEEGRPIPVLILSDPPVASADEAAEQVAQFGKLVVLAIGNIHAGEVDGKEALGMLAREVGLHPHHPLLDHLIIALAPIYNADGNERVSPFNRPGQVGPAEGMGRRENADGLDLNRDFIKLEASETRGLVSFLTRWDPALFIDTHTTNGSFHRYIVTYEGPKTLAGDGELRRYVRDTMLPGVANRLLRGLGRPTFVYGDFNREHTRWETYPSLARFSTSYVGLRNRLSVLSEGYSYASYEERVRGTLDFVRACFEYVAANRGGIRRLLREADARTVAAGRSAPREADRVTLRSAPAAAPQKYVAAGFVEEMRDGRPVSTGQPRDYEVELWNRYTPTLAVTRPQAYAIPGGMSRVAEKLAEHGIEFARLSGEAEFEVERITIEKAELAAEPFQKHRLAEVQAVRVARGRERLAAGTIVAPTAQRLGCLLVYLLEPQSEDGLTTWNFFDEALEPGGEFPVLRVMSGM